MKTRIFTKWCNQFYMYHDKGLKHLVFPKTYFSLLQLLQQLPSVSQVQITTG